MYETPISFDISDRVAQIPQNMNIQAKVWNEDNYENIMCFPNFEMNFNTK